MEKYEGDLHKDHKSFVSKKDDSIETKGLASTNEEQTGGGKITGFFTIDEFISLRRENEELKQINDKLLQDGRKIPVMLFSESVQNGNVIENTKYVYLTEKEAHERMQANLDKAKWQSIETCDTTQPVLIIDAKEPVMRKAVAYFHNSDWWILNSNEHEDGSELIDWEPTHWQKIERKVFELPELNFDEPMVNQAIKEVEDV